MCSSDLYQLVYENDPVDRFSTWARVLLTPVTVVLDATVLLPFNAFASWLDDRDPELQRPGRAR